MKFKTKTCLWCKEDFKVKAGAYRLYCNKKCMRRGVNDRWEKRHPDRVLANKIKVGKDRSQLLALARIIGIKKLKEIAKTLSK